MHLVTIYFILVSQPNIHPGSISSTGRQRGGFCQSSQTVPGMNAAGVITPTMFGPATVCIYYTLLLLLFYLFFTFQRDMY